MPRRDRLAAAASLRRILRRNFHRLLRSRRPLLRACNIGYQMLPDDQAGGDGFYYASLTRR